MEIIKISIFFLLLRLSLQRPEASKASLFAHSNANLSVKCAKAIRKFEEVIKKDSFGERMIHFGALLQKGLEKNK